MSEKDGKGYALDGEKTQCEWSSLTLTPMRTTITRQNALGPVLVSKLLLKWAAK